MRENLLKKTVAGILMLAMCISSIGCSVKENADPITVDNADNAASLNVDVSSENKADAVKTADPFADSKKLTVELGKTYQTIDGFGAAYTWYGDRLRNAKDSAAGYDALFSDARLTILRFKNEYGYFVPDKAANASAMAYNYQQARERAAQYGEDVKILLCCWSPPAWLKSDSTIDTGYGTLKKHDDGTYMYEEYAEWWADSVEYYRSKGIAIDYVSIQNEVDYSPETYEGCRFDATENANHAGYSNAFIAVYNAFKKRFGDSAPRMIAPETMSCSQTALLSYCQPIREKCPESLYGVGYHLYVGGTSSTDTNTVNATSYMTSFDGIRDQFSDLHTWQTEFYVGRGIQTAELVNYAMTEANMTAYLYWSGIWDDSTPNKIEAADLIEVNSSGNWRRSANYYAMRHFSEFIRPGYVRVNAMSHDGKVKCSAYVNDNSTKMAVVLINTGDAELDYVLDIPDYTVTGADGYLSVFGDECRDESKLYNTIGSCMKDGHAVFKLPGKSVITLDVTGYTGSTPAEPPQIVPLVITGSVDTELEKIDIPVQDKTILYKVFDNRSDRTAFQSMGSGILEYVQGGGSDGNGCIASRMRTAEWNGISLSAAYFDNYGYLVRISFDCMTQNEGETISLTSTFSKGGAAYYPSGENNRIVVTDMEPGKWYHAEGYVTMYSDMDPETFRVYWEAPNSKNDFYLDNVIVTAMYTMPAGNYEE